MNRGDSPESVDNFKSLAGRLMTSLLRGRVLLAETAEIRPPAHPVSNAPPTRHRKASKKAKKETDAPPSRSIGRWIGLSSIQKHSALGRRRNSTGILLAEQSVTQSSDNSVA
jgi:hypothetical protein